ncbi:MAG: MoaD/ThiS family protein [Rhodospirillales bacterium]|nr:MoaD/ThiS family protein [Rhodospirillales bacterium]
MKVRIKLYALLGQYLPAGAEKNEAEMEVADGMTPAALIARLGLPQEHCHLVLLNGIYLAPSERDANHMQENDTLAIWPPVAGG